MLADAARRQPHRLHQRLLQLGLLDVAGAMQVGVDRQRLGDADGVGELQGASVGEAGGDDVLGEVAGGIGGGAVDLGRILAGEGAAAMRGRAAVGVDDDLPPGQAAVAVGAADEEFSGRVDVPDGVLGHPAGREGGDGVGLDHLGDLGRGQVLVDVLVRDDDLRRGDRLAVVVAHGDLALGVGAEALLGAGAAGVGKRLQNLVGIVQRRGHQVRRLAAGVAEHDALVASALVLVAGGVDALCDVGGLGVQQHLDLGVLPVEPVLLVADVLDGVAGGLLDRVEGNGGAAHLARDDHAVGGGERLAGDADLVGIEPGLGALAEEQVDHLVRNPVADLVRMSLGNRFAGEEIA